MTRANPECRMDQHNSRIGGLGEVALRVNDLARMTDFYAERIGLEVIKRFPHAVFFKIAEGFHGHTQVLALFDRKGDEPELEVGQSTTTLDHFAFAIAAADYEAEKARLESAGLEVTTAYHEWVGWRSLYVQDPEGNEVELVCKCDDV